MRAGPDLRVFEMIDDLELDSSSAHTGALVPLTSRPAIARTSGDVTTHDRHELILSGEAFVRELAHTALDALDSLGDSIAGVVGLR